jgi:hypothetical protein
MVARKHKIHEDPASPDIDFFVVGLILQDRLGGELVQVREALFVQEILDVDLRCMA